MSEMQRNKGIVKRLSTPETSLEVYKRLISEGHNPEFDDNNEDGSPSYMDSDCYTIVNGCIFDISDAPDAYDDNGEINEAIKLSETDYRVHAYYYNGGASFNEMLARSIPKADADYKKTSKSSFPFKETYSFLHANYKDVLEELEQHLKDIA